MAVAELTGGLSPEARKGLEAELAMFKRVCREMNLTPQRLHKKNLTIFEKAEVLLKTE